MVAICTTAGFTLATSGAKPCCGATGVWLNGAAVASSEEPEKAINAPLAPSAAPSSRPVNLRCGGVF